MARKNERKVWDGKRERESESIGRAGGTAVVSSMEVLGLGDSKGRKGLGLAAVAKVL